ncbi:MAG TPA: SRPBCC family protein [Burkholderiaceae bacterium]|nr:SRPBCC family protein [Burkholderiaceae bacterium]HQR71074.1 SRPBCC family protein [Burkholderiaceae bacterium]
MTPNSAAPAPPALPWPPPTGERLATIESFVLIGRPIGAVFDFVTNASLWSHWHPATESVVAPPRPLKAGEQALESIRAGKRKFSATWTVLACEPPTLWAIAASPPEGDARIVYELRSDGEALTRFFRTLAYRSRRWPWTLLDANLTRSMLTRQSERALANLKRVLEGRTSGQPQRGINTG